MLCVYHDKPETKTKLQKQRERNTLENFLWKIIMNENMILRRSKKYNYIE